MFVFSCTEHMRDGRESFAKIVETKEEVLKLIDKYANGFAGDNCEFHVYELGKEIPIKIETKKKQKPIEYEERRIAKFTNK